MNVKKKISSHPREKKRNCLPRRVIKNNDKVGKRAGVIAHILEQNGKTRVDTMMITQGDRRRGRKKKKKGECTFYRLICRLLGSGLQGKGTRL